MLKPVELRSFCFIFAFLLLSIHLSAQVHRFSAEASEQLSAHEDTLAVLAHTVIHDSIAEHRFAACHQLIPKLVEALKTPNSFHYPFERIQSMSIMYPQDSSFRIFTWQLYVHIDEYRYFGAIQMNQPELKLFPLIDRSEDMQLIDYETLTIDNWYGAVYYKVHKFDTENGPNYLLFGFDGYQFFNKRKLVDVLSFDEKGEPRFGAPVFAQSGNIEAGINKQRILLEYSAETSIRLNYDDQLRMIIFDHLKPYKSPHQAQGTAYLPDGSYEGYRLQDGLWLHIAKVFDQVQDKPPFPQPILDKRKGKDIFGQ